MHEFSLVKAVIDSVESLAEENGWKRIEKVTLRIGAMRQVVPEIMRFAFAAASRDSRLQGAELDIEPVPILVRCPRCGRTWGEERMSMLCPFCGSPDAQMEQGMELNIDSIEVEDDDAKKN